MKAKILTNEDSLLTMFRLGGIETSKFADDNFEEVFRRSVADDNLAVLILDNDSYIKAKGLVDSYRLKNSRPLIVIIGG